MGPPLSLALCPGLGAVGTLELLAGVWERDGVIPAPGPVGLRKGKQGRRGWEGILELGVLTGWGAPHWCAPSPLGLRKRTHPAVGLQITTR